MPTLDNAVVLITGANGGIGTELVTQALARGARKVYATARVPRAWDDERVVPISSTSLMVGRSRRPRIPLTT